MLRVTHGSVFRCATRDRSWHTKAMRRMQGHTRCKDVQGCDQDVQGRDQDVHRLAEFKDAAGALQRNK